MNSVLIALDRSGSYRVYLTVSTELVREAAEIHHTTPLASAGLGRVLTAAGLMGIMMKNESDTLTINFRGDGPAGQILATAHGDGRVKGYIADPYIDLPLNEKGKLDVGGSLGKGELTVIKDMGMKEPYVGTIALVSGEIAEDLTAYFYISEQQNTSVALGVRVEKDLSVGAAGGMIIQMLPGADEEVTGELEKMIGGMRPLTSMIKDIYESSAALSDEGVAEKLLEEIFSGMPEEYMPQIAGKREIRWECDCSRERIEKALMTIGKKDLTEIMEEDGKAEIGCHFCGKKYDFSREDLKDLLDRM